MGSFDRKNGAIDCSEATRLGALVLDKPRKVIPSAEEISAGLMDAVKEHGLELLPWRDADLALRGKLAFLHDHKGDLFPPVDDAALLNTLDTWLEPFLAGVESLGELGRGQLSSGLSLLANTGDVRTIDQLLPDHFQAPSGSKLPISYSGESATLRVRPQELFGLTTHPAVLDGAVAIELELLSPAGRPIQITRDLPGFWTGSWADVRADLRGRYPKHPWPENPHEAIATRRAKQRK